MIHSHCLQLRASTLVCVLPMGLFLCTFPSMDGCFHPAVWAEGLERDAAEGESMEHPCPQERFLVHL